MVCPETCLSLVSPCKTGAETSHMSSLPLAQGQILAPSLLVSKAFTAQSVLPTSPRQLLEKDGI